MVNNFFFFFFFFFLKSQFQFLVSFPLVFLQMSCFIPMAGAHKVLCSECKGANDLDFKFCKVCGFDRSKGSMLCSPTQQLETDNITEKINQRIRTLDELLDASQYSQQKCQLKNELIDFMLGLNPPKDIYSVLPEDLRKFLIFKERAGRTFLHVEACEFRGLPGRKGCDCPRSLAAKSVDTLIGKIRAIFRDMGRSGDWNPVLLTGNPAASHILKRHLQAVTLEQSNLGVVRKQAVPLMFDKLGKLCRYLTYQITREKDSISKFLLLRDRAYLSVICHSGDRGGDLSLLSSDRLLSLPNEEGILVSQVAGKQFSMDNQNNFILYRSKDRDICPIRHLTAYITYAENSLIDLRVGFVFRIWDKKNKTIVNKPMSSSLITDRLRMHLKSINLYEGETSHSTRRGCAITLRMLGVDDEHINEHIGWGRGSMIDHYASIGNICGPKGVARKLSDAAQRNLAGQSDLSEIAQNMSGYRKLTRFFFKS